MLTHVALKSYATFTECMTKIDRTTIDYTYELNMVRPMYNLLEYSWNYSDMIGSL